MVRNFLPHRQFPTGFLSTQVDPVTHALLGSATARIVLARPLGRSAWLPGAAGALLPDADTLIRSGADPLLYA